MIEFYQKKKSVFWKFLGINSDSKFDQHFNENLKYYSLDSPLLDDSVNDGVPSVHVGVEPSIDRGGVPNAPRLLDAAELLVILVDDLFEFPV